MTTETPQLSLARGIPLSEETGIGALTLGEYIREVTQCFADHEAAVMSAEGSTERWSYAELWQRSRQVAKALLASGVGKGTRVGLLMTNRLEFLSGFFGTALAGGVATTISTFFTAKEVDEVLAASGCSVLLFERRVLKKDFAQVMCELIPDLSNASNSSSSIQSDRYPFLRHLAMVDEQDNIGAIEGWQHFLRRGDSISDSLVDAASASNSPSDPGTLFFSSGSTGKAKGILNTHRAVCLQLWRWKNWWGIEQPPRTWSANGFFFSGNFCMALGGTLSSGGSLILQRYFDAEAALSLMQQEKATMLLAWPHQWAQIQGAPNYADTDLSSLHYIDAQSPIAEHPTINTEWREPTQAYGSTEGFTLVSVYPAGTPESIHKNSHGLPTAGGAIKIVDPLTGEIVPIGERGEITIKGATLMIGYIGVVQEQNFDDDGFFHTNDGGYLDADGRLFWEGRLNDIIKTGGANVSPLEIDETLRGCPGVKLVQTVGIADELLGELVVSCIVPHDGHSLLESEIKSFAKQSLASFKVPRHVLFFSEDEFKTTGSNKIVTAELKKLATERLAIQ